MWRQRLKHNLPGDTSENFVVQTAFWCMVVKGWNTVLLTTTSEITLVVQTECPCVEANGTLRRLVGVEVASVRSCHPLVHAKVVQAAARLEQYIALDRPDTAYSVKTA